MAVAVGNKDDNPEQKVVLSQDAQKFAAQSGIALFETSAREDVNIEEVHFGLSKSFLSLSFLNVFK